LRSLRYYIDVRPRSLMKEWSWALSRDRHLSLLDNLLNEICAYFQVSREFALERGKAGDKMLQAEWRAQNPQTVQQIADFYKSSDTYIYELLYWHTCVEDTRPLLYVPAVRLAHAVGALDYLDFGSGAGSQALLFARHGISVTLADIAPQMLDFCRWRFARHDLPAQFIDLNTTALPDGAFDFITAMEVLEHVPDPLKTMRMLVKALKPGGFIYFSAPFHHDELRPMHIVTDPHALWAIRGLGLERVHVNLPDPTFHVFRRVQRHPIVNFILAYTDRITQNRYVAEARWFLRRVLYKLGSVRRALRRPGAARKS
jgi:2-polyprenyl-3-methyl-5-hydroxy-6-metoxy-1,4-benzoquinol methylase